MLESIVISHNVMPIRSALCCSCKEKTLAATLHYSPLVSLKELKVPSPFY